MDLRSLNIFIQAAELNSFTRAAEKLGYSQPTVSFQIKQLEQELGVQLFDRIGHTVSLTEAGRDALFYAQKICHTSQEMVLGASRRQEIRGEVRLAMADSLCIPLFVDAFAKFREEYPYVLIKTMTAGTDELFRLLDHNEVDMVCTLDKQIRDTTYIIANEERIGVHFVVCTNHPLASRYEVSVEELLDQPFMLTEKGMSYRKILDEYLAGKSLEIHPVLEIGSADLICQLVQEDVGISFLPDYVTEHAVRKGKLVRLHVDDFEAEVWKQLLYHRNKWMSAPLEAVMKHLEKIMLQVL
ncbi:MAG: LysR family transcriptional regulator [Lachnospiraceae bacterium]|nr:LysR family transcriptional regulator [Lachnospiraceae bacterium]